MGEGDAYVRVAWWVRMEGSRVGEGGGLQGG